jgi:DNA-directed RNA polymerase I, II, and III subunit RPABC1
MEKTILTEMLNDRGYNISFGDEPYIATSNTNNSRILICFSDEAKVNINTVKNQISKMSEYSITHSILVYKDVITSSALKAIECLENTRIELFSVKELQYNITKHRLVPKHEKYTRDDMKKHADSLPVLLKTDVVCRYYDFNRGDIIEITRTNGFKVYRIVK